jgi:hypothetical protein
MYFRKVISKYIKQNHGTEQRWAKIILFQIPIALLDVKGKGKAIPLQAWRGPEGSRRVRLPDFMTLGT